MHAHPTTYNLNKKTFLCETTNMLILRCHVTSQLKKKMNIYGNVVVGESFFSHFEF